MLAQVKHQLSMESSLIINFKYQHNSNLRPSEHCNIRHHCGLWNWAQRKSFTCIDYFSFLHMETNCAYVLKMRNMTFSKYFRVCLAQNSYVLHKNKDCHCVNNSDEIIGPSLTKIKAILKVWKNNNFWIECNPIIAFLFSLFVKLVIAKYTSG